MMSMSINDDGLVVFHRPWIDWLRASAVFGVMAYHGNNATSGIGLVSGTGWVGVDLFFVLSGFLVTSAWLRKPNVGVFLHKRGRRVLPALWACLAIGLGSAAIMGSPFTVFGLMKEGIANLVFAGNALPLMTPSPKALGPLWSLSVEVQFWFLIPLCAPLVQKCARKWRLRTAMALLALPLLMRLLAMLSVHGLVAPYRNAETHAIFGSVIYALLPTHMDGLLMGMFLAVDDGIWIANGSIRKCAIALIPIVMAVGAPFRTYLPRPMWVGLFQYTFLAIGFATLVSIAWKSLDDRPAPAPIRWVSDRIFSLYLAQAIVGVVLGPLVAMSLTSGPVGQVVLMMLFVGASTGAGAVLYRQVEARFAANSSSRSRCALSDRAGS
jgi:peptidoglycan/LPS O-acetylase OafA/YrhL